MPEYLAPGVYIEEVDSGNKPIEGVSTSTSGFVGLTLRGPTTGLPQLVTSFSEFQRLYGGYFDFGPNFVGHNAMPYAVDGFFTNLGKRLYVMRVVPGNASAATARTHGGLVTRLRDDTSTELAKQHQLTVTTLRGIHVGTQLHLRMIKDGVVTDSPATLNVTAIDRNTNLLTVGPVISTTTVFEARYTTVFTDINALDTTNTANVGLPTTIPTPVDPRPASFLITARNKGAWGNDIVVQAFHDAGSSAVLDAFISDGAGELKIRLKSTAGFYPKAWVEIDRGSAKRYLRVKSVSGQVLTLEDQPAAGFLAADFNPQAPATTTIFTVCEFRLVVSYGGVTEQYTHLTLENVPGHYYADIINQSSTIITVDTSATATHPFLFPSGDDGLRVTFDTAGFNGTTAPLNSDYVGTDGGPGNRTGIQALVDIDQISIIATPGVTSQVVQNALIAQCEEMKYRFAILDPAPKSSNLAPDLNDIQNQRNLYDTKYAAIYYPRIKVYNPLSDTYIAAPPSGHMAGIYARTDNERGVHKAPANEVIAGITDLELLVNKGEQEILNPSPVNINVLRDFRTQGRGLRVWGARVITSDTDWKYINVRRLFIFIEKSIEEGTQWAVFEPNDYRLWARVSQSISNFLTRVWRDGALMGTKPEQAFFVRCDLTTMTQDDIDNGRLIIIVGIAPVKPAEFVIIRIGQWAGGSSVEEL
jgi:phage tail sheath protein FI